MDLVRIAGDLGLDALLDDQNGVLRRDQALAAGVGRSRVDDLVRRRRWDRILPNVYVVGGAAPSAAQRVRAAWLWGGPTSTIGGAAAAFWLGLHTAEPEIIDVLKMTGSRLVAPGYRVQRSTVHDPDWCWRDRIRVTTTARTCLDLARVAADDASEEGLRRRLVTVPLMQRSLPNGFHRRGQVAARTLVADLADGPWSKGETVAHRHLRAAGITGWVANLRVVVNGAIHFVDIAFEDVKLDLEIDGFETHGNRVAFVQDRRRQNRLIGAGWTILQFTWDDLQDPAAFAATVRRTLQRLREQAR